MPQKRDFRYSVAEVLSILEDDDFQSADIFILPPEDPTRSDEDSGPEDDDGDVNNLTGNQLRALAEATVTVSRLHRVHIGEYDEGIFPNHMNHVAEEELAAPAMNHVAEEELAAQAMNHVAEEELAAPATNHVAEELAAPAKRRRKQRSSLVETLCCGSCCPTSETRKETKTSDARKKGRGNLSQQR